MPSSLFQLDVLPRRCAGDRRWFESRDARHLTSILAAWYLRTTRDKLASAYNSRVETELLNFTATRLLKAAWKWEGETLMLKTFLRHPAGEKFRALNTKTNSRELLWNWQNKSLKSITIFVLWNNWQFCCGTYFNAERVSAFCVRSEGFSLNWLWKMLLISHVNDFSLINSRVNRKLEFRSSAMRVGNCRRAETVEMLQKLVERKIHFKLE